MSKKFRDDLISNDVSFRYIFNDLLEKGDIKEYPDSLWKIILSDKTPIRINREPFAFKDLFHLDLNEGRCKMCATEMVLLLDKLGYYSEAVECVNEHLKGTVGSVYGGHWYVEVKSSMEHYLIDTSLVIVGSVESFERLGHKVIRKIDIDTLFKEDSSLIDYYDNMIIDRTRLH